ncbi:MAG: SGNH/GDSL hydrolase family protein [Verrucomicrobiales bacterium]|nr:SGNH/GDSL hydrolase family protein [Verrucomicrobiales bacterium]
MLVGLLLVAAIPRFGQAQDVAAITIPVDSPAFTFSPGNWSGDEGRSGQEHRQTWNPGAYFRVSWESNSETDEAPVLLLDTSTHGEPFGSPRLAYVLDGVWQGNVSCAEEILLQGARPSGKHQLTVYLKSSVQKERWGSNGISGRNILRVKGLRIGTGGKPVVDKKKSKWALIVGDSITEGIGASELEGYSHLVGEALLVRGYGYAISACGWSGWLNRGDNPPGDVPGYYVVKDSVDGRGGEYIDELSRWNKMDANHSLLDANGRISANGGTGQEPSLILINYGTNDTLHKQNSGDVQAGISQCLFALRKAAPGAHICVLIPFGQYKATELYEAVKRFKTARPADRKISIIDLGPDAKRALAVKNGYWGGLHPNPRAHATFAARIIAQLPKDL